MKKSHKWVETVRVRCPHCCVWGVHEDVGDVGDIAECPMCGKQFELGKQG